MRTLASLLAAAAIAAFGFATPASADKWADTVESFSTVTGSSGDGTEATDSPDGTATDLGFDGGAGALTLNFTDNTCLVLSSADDLDVVELGDNDSYAVAVGNAGTLLADGNGTGTDDVDVSSAGLGGFNQVRLTATDDVDADMSGAEIDAVACINNFDFGSAHITKANLGGGTINIQSKGGFNAQQFFFFKITIANPEDEDLSDLVIQDVLPAEFDLDPVAEDVADGGGIDACASGDGVCDGVRVTVNAADCSATGAEHTNQGKSGKSFKLQPDIVTIDAGGLGDDESCEVTVWAMTDRKANNPKKVTWTPTECNEGSFIFLNEGVEVIHTNGTTDPSDDFTLFVDDDQIELICTGP